MKALVFFNNRGGLGTTTLVYHVAHMCARLGHPALAVDLDPQANLTAMFFAEERIEELLENPGPGQTLYSCVEPIMEGTGDIREPSPVNVAENIHVLGGDLRLSLFEDRLSEAWPRTFERKPDALRVMSSFYRIIRRGAEKTGAEIVLVDVGPNLGAINRAALLSTDFLIVPLAADLFSLQGLKNLGPMVRKWREDWHAVINLKERTIIEIPAGIMKPLGYVILQHSVRLDRPVHSYEKWSGRIPGEYSRSVLNEEKAHAAIKDDVNCLSIVRHYRSLVPMAHDAHKPLFDLKPADGAIGSHVQLVKTAFSEFRSLAEEILQRMVEAEAPV